MSDKDLICSLKEAYNASLEKGSVTLSTTFIEHLLVILGEINPFEQEPLEPKRASATFGSTYRWWYICGNCGLDIRDGKNKWEYCPRCGRGIKWGMPV